jgi:hypothetical protein
MLTRLVGSQRLQLANSTLHLAMPLPSRVRVLTPLSVVFIGALCMSG